MRAKEGSPRAVLVVVLRGESTGERSEQRRALHAPVNRAAQAGLREEKRGDEQCETRFHTRGNLRLGPQGFDGLLEAAPGR